MPRDKSEESMTFEELIEDGTTDIAGTYRRATGTATALTRETL
jgi:hypothetical protein